MKNIFKGKIGLARIAGWTVIFVVLYINFNTSFWKDENRVITNDIISYYAYLPATFVYNDITLDFIDNGHREVGKYFWPKTSPIGKKVIITSCGMSMMYFPFFIIAHPVTQFIGYPADGFSMPYKFAIVMSCVFYLAFGLYFLRRFLLKYFSQTVTAITIITIGLGTNLLWYATVEAAMTHVYSFSLISAFIYFTDKWHGKQTLKYTIILGLLTGIITLIRPTNLLVVLLLVLWKVTTWKELTDRLMFFLKRWYLLILMIIAAFLVWAPQFFYWKLVAGQYLYYSYPDDTGFFFNNPQLWKNLFSWRKGWLIYTPVMIFALIGIGLLYRINKGFFYPVLIYFLISWYVISSWFDWWYGGGLGIRPYIDSYGIFAIPVAAFLTWALKQKPALKVISFVLFFALGMQGTFHYVQYYYGAIHWDSMTKEAYFDSFWHVRWSDDFESKLKAPDYQLARKGIYDFPETDEK